MQQKYQSDKTSLNQVPATFKKLELEEGSVNLDFGGGKYDKATEFLKEKNITNLVYDPFNRSELHNLKVRHAILKNNGADTFTVNNVLNVIQENSIINHVIEQVSTSLKENGKGYFLMFEGDRRGIGRETIKGWQRNEKPQAYLEHISKHFENVKKRGIFVEVNKPLNPQLNDGLFTFEAVYQDLLSIIKKEGIPTPNSKTKVGKEIGGNLYIHKSAKDQFPDGLLQQFEQHLPKDFEYEIIKWNKKRKLYYFFIIAKLGYIPRTNCWRLHKS